MTQEAQQEEFLPKIESDSHQAYGVVSEFADSARQLAYIADGIGYLLQCDRFKYASKGARNKMLEDLVSKADEVNDLLKVAYKAVKKVKREKISEEDLDNMLGVSQQ